MPIILLFQSAVKNLLDSKSVKSSVLNQRTQGSLETQILALQQPVRELKYVHDQKRS